MAAALQLEGISKTFGENRALDGAHFAADWGTVHGLLGENGAGVRKVEPAGDVHQ